MEIATSRTARENHQNPLQFLAVEEYQYQQLWYHSYPSKHGAHNQRAHVTLTLETNDFIWIEDIIEAIEKQASCELYGILKRPDEKYVTEKAYENPKFVEDIVRDIAADLKENTKVNKYTIESENFESIHNHSAYALIEGSNI